MDYATYRKIRAYCWQDLAAYLDGEGQAEVMQVFTKQHGPIGAIQREQEQAHALFHCTDLTPREVSAAHLLAVVSNHRAIAWQREPKTPDGRPPAAPLTSAEAAALAQQTADAVTGYCAFIPEREAAALLRLIEAAPVVTESAPVERSASKITYHHPLFQRLEPRTDWKGGRMTGTDILTLEDAARFASQHAGTEITVSDFLRAAGRGEISLRAIVHRSGRMASTDGAVLFNSGTPAENIIPAGAIPTLPLTACQHLAATGRASWRTYDGFKQVGGEFLRYTKGALVEGEPDFETVPDDCRVTGDAVHALADSYPDSPDEAQQPAPVTEGSASEPAGPLPLATGDIAFCFAGLRWTEQEWRKPLGDKPKWLEACIAVPGRRGVSETRWYPVCIAAALVRNGHANARSVRAAFQRQPLLMPWLEAWKTYEADYIDSE